MTVKVYERWGSVALLGGVVCYVFALMLIVLAPAWLTDAEEPYVTDVVTGERVRVAEYTEAQKAGREVYIKQVCWHCHSQFVRPVNDENLRYGPVSQAGESTIDRPHLFGTRRIGPDLTREGGLRTDAWHDAHFYDPRFTVPMSVMPSFPWLYRPYGKAETVRSLIARFDIDGDGLVTPEQDVKVLQAMPWWAANKDTYDEELLALQSPDIDVGGVLAPDEKQGESVEALRAYVDRYTERDVRDLVVSDYDARPRRTKDAENLIAYLQSKGTAVGAWRKPISTDTPIRTTAPPKWGIEAISFGSFQVFDDEGKPVLDASGRPVREPREAAPVYDGEMPLRAREARVYGLAAEMMSPAEREEVRFLEEEYAVRMAAWRTANPAWNDRLARGKELYERNCTGCHGETGRGNGDAAQFMDVRPRDFTTAQFRYRSTQAGNLPLDGDLYRSIYQGLPGTTMPAWREMPEEHIWLLVDYIKHFQETDRGLAKPFNDESLRLATPPIPPMPVERADELFLRGRAIYVAMKCNNCHGSTGRGDGPGWNTTPKSNGGLVRPRDFAKRHDKDQPELRLRGGATPRDIYRTVFTGLDGTGMPSTQNDFNDGLKKADELDRLIAAGAADAEIAAARDAARVQMFSNLGEELPGVVVGEKDGRPTEFVDRLNRTVIFGQRGTFGDDWALIWYVYRLLHGPDATWPVSYSEEE